MNSPQIEDNNAGDKPQASNKEDIPPEYLGSVLRAEIMPASEITTDEPGYRSFVNRLDFRYVGIIFVIMIVIGLSLVCFIGPGRPFLENSLLSLRDRYEQPTSTVRPTQIVQGSDATRVVPTQRSTPTITPTLGPPTLTATLPQTPTSTEEDPCKNAVDVSLDDVGSTLCVRGIITGMEEREVGYLIYFSDQRGVFYLVTYDLVWDEAEPGDCIQITGEIQLLGNTPVLVFGWNNLPEICP